MHVDFGLAAGGVDVDVCLALDLALARRWGRGWWADLYDAFALLAICPTRLKQTDR